MSLNNEINNINRSIKENQQNAERLQRLSDNRQSQKIILQNALLGAILDGLNNNENIYNDNFISYTIDLAINRAEVDNNDITKEYARFIYYTVANKATSAYKKENEQTQKELTAYQVEQLKIARERLEFQRQKEADRLRRQEQKEAERLQYEKQKETIRQAAEAKQSFCNVLMLVILAPIMVLVGFIDAAAKSK